MRKNSEADKIHEIQQELIEVAISGGMMGGYLEEGFPFYYINEKMLEYLGYEDEDSFVRDIDGLITNCMHPEDRARVDKECDEQLDANGKYELDYRMRRRDGNYIWVHDLGKQFTTEDGRIAIMSLCYDITKEKETLLFQKNLLESMNGSVANYLVDSNGKLEVTYVSSNMGRMLGFDADEYREICKNDAMDCIIQEDRNKLIHSIFETIRENKETSISFRALNSKGGYTWLNSSYSKAGEIDGRSLIRVVFTPVTTQFELQQDIIHNMPGGVCLYKWDGTTIYPLVFSDQFATLYGGEVGEQKKEISGVNYEYVHPDDLVGYKKFVQQIIQEPGQKRSYTFRFLHFKEKRYHWISVNTTDLVQDDGTLLIYANYNDVNQIKEAEEKLRRNEEMLEQTCSFADVWTFIYDVETKVVYPGKSLQEAFDLQEEEPDFPECMLRTPYIPEHSKEDYREMARRIDAGDDSVKTEIEVVYPNGDSHWLQYEWKIIEYLNDSPKVAIGYAKGIDDKKLLEARIKMEQERLLGGDGTLLAYIVSNITKNVIVENKAFLGETPFSVAGQEMESLAVVTSSSIVSEEKRKEVVEKHTRKYLETVYNRGISTVSSEYQRRKSNGIIFWEKNVLNVLRDPESGDLYLYEYCYDVNKEKLLEEVILAAINYDYERFGSINLEDDQISILVPNHNTNSYDLVVKKYSQLCREYAISNVYEEDRKMFLSNVLEDRLVDRLKETGSFEFTHRELDQNGEIHYKLDRHAYYDKEKKICLLTRSDITDMVKAEEEKQNQLQLALQKEKEAAKAKSDFLSRMSHELRTPLNAITGYSALLEENARVDQRDRTEDLTHLAAVNKATKYLLAIIGDLLDTQKIETGKVVLVKDRTEAVEYMDNIVEMISLEATRKKIEFAYEQLTPCRKYYYVDGVRLQQVLLNLLYNAIKFTPHGGKVELKAEAFELGNHKEQLKFTISDTGIGMSKEFMQNQLYKTFSQENQDITSPYEGTGIGLAISRELVELMDGEINCVSEKGKGTTFTFTILADSEEAEKRKRREHTKETFDLGGIRVLICEDNPMNQDMTKRLLGRMNCQVEVADDGKIGVQKFKESPKGYFNLVLMDLRMPEMDGFEATRNIRALEREDAKKLPILALSANAFDEDIRMSLDAGMNEHLAKPVDARILYNKIKHYCNMAG